MYRYPCRLGLSDRNFQCAFIASYRTIIFAGAVRRLTASVAPKVTKGRRGKFSGAFFPLQLTSRMSFLPIKSQLMTLHFSSLHRPRVLQVPLVAEAFIPSFEGCHLSCSFTSLYSLYGPSSRFPSFISLHRTSAHSSSLSSCPVYTLLCTKTHMVKRYCCTIIMHALSIIYLSLPSSHPLFPHRC